MMKDYGYTAKRNYSDAWVEFDTVTLLISYEPARLINKTRVTLEISYSNGYEFVTTAYFGSDAYRNSIADILGMAGLFVDSFNDETRDGFEMLEHERQHMCSRLGVCPF